MGRRRVSQGEHRAISRVGGTGSLLDVVQVDVRCRQIRLRCRLGRLTLGMFRTIWVTHRLGLAVAATAVLVVGSSTTLAQSAAAQTKEPAETKPTSLSLFDSKVRIGTKSRSGPEEWLAGFEMKCIGCGYSEARGAHPESMNRNAPWVLQGSWRRETAFGVICVFRPW